MKWTGFVRAGGKRFMGGHRTGAVCFSTTNQRLKVEHIVKSPLTPITIQEISTPQYIFEKFDQWSDRPAVACGLTGRVYTFRDVRKMSQSIAGSLVDDLGMKRQGVVATILPNTPEFPAIAMGVMEAGMSLSPINFLYTPHEMVNQLLDSKSEVIFTIPERVGAVLEAKELLKAANKAQGEKLQVVVTPSITGEEPKAPKGTTPMSELTKREPRKMEKVDHNGIAVLPYSSGTTGLPKGVLLTHRNIVTNLLQMQHEEVYDFAPSDTPDIIPCILPMFHIYGLVVVALHSLASGSKLVTLPRFEPTFFLKMLLDHKATVLFAVPPILLFLGSSPFVTKEHLGSLRLILSGAAPIGESDIKACQVKAPLARFKQGYGLTECAPGVIYQPKEWDKFDSVGIPMANTDVKIVDMAKGDSLPAGRRGEICVRGPQVMKGYLNNPKATEESIDKDGWYHTGDIGYYDEDGHFYIVDRVKELIKVKGFQVAPAELEELLRTHPAVKDAGVIGVKDPRLGERPVAFVAFHPETTAPHVEDLKGFVNTRVAPYKQIEEFIFINNVERSPAGKILRRELKDLYMKEHAK